MNFAKYGLERRFASKATSRRVRFAMHFQLQATLEAARKLQVLSASKVAAGAESQSARKNVVEVDFKNRITTSASSGGLPKKSNRKRIRLEKIH